MYPPRSNTHFIFGRQWDSKTHTVKGHTEGQEPESPGATGFISCDHDLKFPVVIDSQWEISGRFGTGLEHQIYPVNKASKQSKLSYRRQFVSNMTAIQLHFMSAGDGQMTQFRCK
jgi:hypothetical protein